MAKTKKSKIDNKKQASLGIKKDDDDIKKYAKLLNIKNKKRSFLSDIFSSMNGEFSEAEEEGSQSDQGKEEDEIISECEVDEELDSEDCDQEMLDSDDCDSEIENSEECVEEVSDCDEDMDAVVQEVSPKKSKQSVEICNKNEVSELHQKIKRNLLQHLNKLCEAQMMKCLDGVEEIWNSFPRGDVRDVFIKESIAFMKFSCLDLAAFVVCLHIRLCKHTNMVAFYVEYLVEKLSAYKPDTWANESTFLTIMSIFKFIAYVTRLETIDCNLILDLMTDTIATFALPQLKVLAEVSSIIGFYMRKNSSSRCESFVKLLRESMAKNLSGRGDMDEMKSYGEATVDKLTSSKAKSDVVFQSVEKYRKLMRKWSRNGALSQTIALQLADFRGLNRVRWWLVGSAVDPNVAHNKSAAATASTKHDTFTEQEQEWNDIAHSLGLSTEGKKTLFRILMAGKAREDTDDIKDTMEAIYTLMKSSGGAIVISEGDVVRSIVRCLSLDTDFCQLYVNVLAALLEGHRRFRQMIKCAVWDVLAQPKSVESLRSNCGRCLGQLIALAGMPVNCLKKFNFIDDSPSNTAFMKSVMIEILEENWDDIAELLRQMLLTISVKFIGNLRLFLKKNFAVDASAGLSRSQIFKVNKCMETMQELRRNSNSSLS